MSVSKKIKICICSSIFMYKFVVGELFGVVDELGYSSSVVPVENGESSQGRNSCYAHTKTKEEIASIATENSAEKIEDEDDTYEKHFDKAAIELDSVTVQVCQKSGVRTTQKKIFINEPYEFDNIKIILRKCFKSAPDKALCISAFLEVYERQTNQHNSESNYNLIFSGWMFSSSQSVNSLEHHQYYIKIENVL